MAGCRVSDGPDRPHPRARVLRKRQPVYDGGLATPRHFQDDVKEVRSGIMSAASSSTISATDYRTGDIIRCYQLEKFAQKL